jgi:7,8-dihydro-6-hydroxymethylpterin-pyrophosphokinase
VETLTITKENQAQYFNTAVVFEGHIELGSGLGWLNYMEGFKAGKQEGRRE